MAELQQHFIAFASFGTGHQTEMDSSKFTKMLKECKIIDNKKFTGTDADMIFTKVKTKGARKITFNEFVDKALPEIATKLKSTPDAVASQIASHAPQSSGTKADAVKFHDDKDQYTGVYAAGGPTNVDRNAGSLSGVVDRRVGNDVRGVTTSQRGPT